MNVRHSEKAVPVNKFPRRFHFHKLLMKPAEEIEELSFFWMTI